MDGNENSSEYENKTHTQKKKQAAADDASLKKQYKANKINNKINWKNFYIKDCKYI